MKNLLRETMNRDSGFKLKIEQLLLYENKLNKNTVYRLLHSINKPFYDEISTSQVFSANLLMYNRS